jgi:hypothetical protein
VDGDHAYVLAPLAESVVEFPVQTARLVGVTVTVGVGLSVTTAVASTVQPAATVPTTVYVVVTVGDAFTVAPVVVDKPDDGDQVYVDAPFAVRSTLPPLHNTGDAGFTVTVAFAIT